MSNEDIGNHNEHTPFMDRVLFPAEGYSAQDIVDYYRAVSPLIMPFLKDRLLTVARFPDGVCQRKYRNLPLTVPDWIEWLEGGRQSAAQVLCRDMQTLEYLATVSCLTPHVALNTVDNFAAPLEMIFDLDPAGDDFEAVREMAIALRDILALLELPSYPMTTGGRGMHVRVPLDGSADYDQVRRFAQDVSLALADCYPDEITLGYQGVTDHRIVLSTARNAGTQTAAAPYSLRVRPGATVATPLDWNEVLTIDPQGFDIRSVPARIKECGDVWRGMSEKPRSLLQARQILDSWISHSKGNSQAA